MIAAACGGAPPPPPPPPPPPVTAQPEPPPGPPLPESLAALGTGAILFEDLGTLHHAVTASPEAQPYFDQGLRLDYGFNHDESARSFARAAQIDPGCAMCFWGVALTLGPNYNMPMLPERSRAAWDAMQRARELAPKAAPLEQALIEALARRYKGPEPLDAEQMAPFNVAYASAMRDVAKRFPDDDDAQVLFAEALMDTNPWKLWSVDGQAAPGTEEIIATLERVLTRAPGHPGANHYCIHAIEASPHPERALPCAERLAGAMPGAGHVVHMPAHVYQRVGRYQDASAANELAILADKAYAARTKPPGYYSMYQAHNYGFLAFSASMEGRSGAAIRAARASAGVMMPGVCTMPGMDFFVAEPILVLVRFGHWEELLQEPRPDPKYLEWTAMWLHGHGMALAATGKYARAHADRTALEKMAAEAPATLTVGVGNSAKDVFTVAAKILEARLATLEKKKNALDLWADAVARADKLAYDEPDDWFYSVRTYEGAALLARKKARKAEAVYREDLARHPHSGWALFGLWKALEAQHQEARAKAVRAEFDVAWAKADVKLTASAF